MRRFLLVIVLLLAAARCSEDRRCRDGDVTCQVQGLVLLWSVCQVPYDTITRPIFASAVQEELRLQARQGVSGSPAVSTFGSHAFAADIWGSGGVLAPNGKIYGIPNDQNNINNQILVLDPLARTTKTFAGPGGAGSKWGGGALGADGKIYAFPLGANTSILVIDPATDTATVTGSLAGKYFGASLAPNGSIYGLPVNGSAAARFNPATGTISTFGPTTGTYRTGPMALNEKIYALSDGTVAVPIVLEIDPAVDSASTFGPSTAGLASMGGGLASDGRIYAAALGAHQSILVEPDTRTVTFFGPTQAGNAYEGNVTAPSGKVYGTPRGALAFAEIDINGPTFTTISSALAAYTGVLASDGNIYLIPRSSSAFGVIETRSRGRICNSLLLSSYFNKY